MDPVLEVDLKEFPLFKKGKVREIYDLGDNLLIISTDRISAFDYILPTGIPGKGKLLNKLSSFWFQQTESVVNNHFITDNFDDFPESLQMYKNILEDRSMIVKKADLIEIECVVRGYISGSAWKEYKQFGTMAGETQPEGLVESGKLAKPWFTPATKAQTGHDENITFQQMSQIVGEDIALEMAKKSIELYTFAAEQSEELGFILADTKFEFGFLDGEIILIDELLTSDSSRYWQIDDYTPGQPQNSFDKQFVRDYLESISWDKQPPVPELPQDIVDKTYEKYRYLYKSFTDNTLKGAVL